MQYTQIVSIVLLSFRPLLCMQGAPARGTHQLFARVQRAKPFKAKTRGPVFGSFRLDPPLVPRYHMRHCNIRSLRHKTSQILKVCSISCHFDWSRCFDSSFFTDIRMQTRKHIYIVMIMFITLMFYWNQFTYLVCWDELKL